MEHNDAPPSTQHTLLTHTHTHTHKAPVLSNCNHYDRSLESLHSRLSKFSSSAVTQQCLSFVKLNDSSTDVPPIALNHFKPAGSLLDTALQTTEARVVGLLQKFPVEQVWQEPDNDNVRLRLRNKIIVIIPVISHVRLPH